MKNHKIKTALIVFLMCISQVTYCQFQLNGIWEGFFMNDFKTVIELKSDENNMQSGNIKMFKGGTVIQDDPLSKVTISNEELTFFIAAKETIFKGEFKNNKSELSGKFVFPDESEYPIELVKKTDNPNSANNSVDENEDARSIKYSGADLISDIDNLVENLKLHHPRLYAYTSENDFNQLVEFTKQNLKKEMDLIEFYTLVAPLLAEIKCSHTCIRLPFKIENELHANSNYLPLKLLFEEGVFCLENFDPKSEIIPGSEIVSINQVPIQVIIEKLNNFFSSEGNNATVKNYMLNRNFNYYFNLIDNSPKYIVEYKNEGKIQSELLNACTYSNLNFLKETVNEKQVHFLIDKKNNTSYLTVKSFQFPDINKYIQEMDEMFLQIQENNIGNLVLDLRGNSGGHPIFAAQLFSYLTNKEFTWFERNEEIQEFEPLYNKMNPGILNFGGKLYVLCDGGCLSTTGHLLAQIQYHTNAIFIGNEPGSLAECNDFSLKFQLPNTKLEVNIPRTTFVAAVGKSGETRHFEIDYNINPTAIDYLEEKDIYLSCVNHLILNP